MKQWNGAPAWRAHNWDEGWRGGRRVRRGRNVLIWRPYWQNIQLLGQETEEGSVELVRPETVWFTLLGCGGYTSPDLGQTSPLHCRIEEPSWWVLPGNLCTWCPSSALSTRVQMLGVEYEQLVSPVSPLFPTCGSPLARQANTDWRSLLSLSPLRSRQLKFCFVFAKFTQQLK